MKSWTVPFNKVIASVEDKENVIIRKIALDLFKKVILKTPVLSGRARGNWYVSVGVPARVEQDTQDKSGMATIAMAQSEIYRWSPKDNNIYLTNNLPYIYGLERGRSKKAPNGMVKISIAEVMNEH